MYTSVGIIFEQISSTVVSDLCGLIQRILQLIIVKPYYKLTVPLIKQRVRTLSTILWSW